MADPLNLESNFPYINYGRVVTLDERYQSRLISPDPWEAPVAAFIEVPDSLIDTALGGFKTVAYQLDSQGKGDVRAKVQGSMDGNSWYDLKTTDENGTVRSSATLTFTADTTGVAPQYCSLNADHLQGFRYFRVVAQALYHTSPGYIVVDGLAK